jgi:ElaB/YqjD/DUF883 family membrane-anchored ribosome-binding protein
LSPQQLVNETFDYIRHGGPGEFTENLGDSVKNNPVPFLVTTIGLSWLILAHRYGSANSNHVGTATGDNTSSTSGFSETKDKVKNTAQHALDGVHDMKTQVRNRSAQVRDKSQAAFHNASDGARNAGVQVKHFVEENPFAAAAIGIGIGALLGGMFPASRVENEKLGEMRDRLVDKASEAGVEQAEKLSAKAREKASEAGTDNNESTASPPHSDATNKISPNENLG